MKKRLCVAVFCGMLPLLFASCRSGDEDPFADLADPKTFPQEKEEKKKSPSLLDQLDFSGSERAAVAYAFGAAHGLMAMEATFEELVDQGYISASPLLASGSDEEIQEPEHYFYEWEDGCLFSITERDEPVVFSMPSQAPGREATAYEGIRFDAGKWRTSLAAYMFSNCTAGRMAGGPWGDYTVEAEMVS